LGNPGKVDPSGKKGTRPDRTDLALVAQRNHLGELVIQVDDLVTLGAQSGPQPQPAQVDHVDPFNPQLRG
jgi:hypothetical protein